MEVTVILKSVWDKVLVRAFERAKDAFLRHRAGAKAIEGGNLAQESSLEHLVATELETLAKSGQLPQGLQSSEFRAWCCAPQNLEPFVRALLGKAGSWSGLRCKAEQELASEYARITGETHKLAARPIGLAVDYVYGRLNATNSGKQALGIALSQATTARVFALADPSPDVSPRR